MLKRDKPERPKIKILYEGQVSKNKPSVRKKPDIIRLGESDKEMKSLTKSKKKKPKKEALFIRVLNRLLKLDHLKLLDLSIGFVKGFGVKIEFFENKTKDKEKTNA